MITEKEYSKQPGIMPEGIVITFGREMIKDHGGLRTFLKVFLESMNAEDTEESGWCHKMKNKPQFDVDHIYIIIENRLMYRVYSGGYRMFDFVGEKCNGAENIVSWPGLFLSGPIERCPFKRTLKGFQGFRYSTKLW